MRGMTLKIRRRGRRRPPGAEVGQVMPLILVALLLAGLAAAGVLRVAAVASQRSSAQAAADAAALAGAAEGPDAARQVASANNARLVAYRQTGDDVTVTVERHGVRGRATARWLPGVPSPRRGAKGGMP